MATILVVDDDRAVRESLRRSLTFNGYTVDTAGDGIEALEKIVAERPDVAILDVMMPRLDGLEVCRRLRSTGDDLPILVLTTESDQEKKERARKLGATGFIIKPFNPTGLVDALRKVAA